MGKEFLAFTYKIPSEPSKNRVYVWRMIKELGAIYLQQGVALLPYDENLYSTLINLREQVHSFGGKSTIGKLDFLEKEDEKEIIEEFTKQIDEEYGEFINNCQGLIDELECETSNGVFNFSEVMESEEDYKKYERWFEKIIKKDYFNSDNQARAAKVLNQAKEKLQEYSDEAYRRDPNARFE